MRSEFLPFHRHEVGAQEIDSVVKVLKSAWITSGPKVAEFETQFASYVGAKYALAVNSCTAALHLALDAIGLKEGDEVLVPSMTFAATSEAVIYFRAKPVLVDVDRNTQNIDLQDAEKKLTPKTRAMIPVHVAGLPCDMPAIVEFAKAKKLRLIEDAAHAFPTKSRGQWIGKISEATCFSFYATKTITTGEGGMLTTDDLAIAERVKMMRIHGLNRDAWKRSSTADSWSYEILQPGFKYNMTDVAAAMGVPQLAQAEKFRAAREKIARSYQKAFSNLEEVMTPPEGLPDDLHSWHLYTLRLKPECLKIDRNQFVRNLRERNIGSSVHWIPLHLHPYYRENFGYKADDFPNASWLSERIVSLPLFPAMNDRDVSDVIEAVNGILKESRR